MKENKKEKVTKLEEAVNTALSDEALDGVAGGVADITDKFATKKPATLKKEVITVNSKQPVKPLIAQKNVKKLGDN